MKWYWIGLIAGVLAPWLVFRRELADAFRSGGPVRGFGMWTGMLWVHVPIFLLIMWAVHAIID